MIRYTSGIVCEQTNICDICDAIVFRLKHAARSMNHLNFWSHEQGHDLIEFLLDAGDRTIYFRLKYPMEADQK